MSPKPEDSNMSFCFRLQDVDETMTEFPELDNPESDRVRTFIQWLNSNKPYPVAIRFIR